jgi:hypothetical protein
MKVQMEATCSSEMFVFQQTTQHHIPEDTSVQNTTAFHLWPGSKIYYMIPWNMKSLLCTYHIWQNSNVYPQNYHPIHAAQTNSLIKSTPDVYRGGPRSKSWLFWLSFCGFLQSIQKNVTTAPQIRPQLNPPPSFPIHLSFYRLILHDMN